MEIFLGGGITVSDFIKGFLPCNYFVVLYCTLYFISPYLNIIVHSLKKSKVMEMTVILFVVFSVIPSITDVLMNHFEYLDGLSTITRQGSLYGYTIVNFVLMYLIGSCIAIYENEISQIILWKVFLVLILDVGVITICGLYCAKEYSSFREGVQWAYCNPFIVMEAIGVFIIFHNLKIRNIFLINKLSDASYTVYLLHPFILKVFWNEYKFVLSLSPILMLISIIGILLITYLVCYLFHIPWSYYIRKSRLLKKIDYTFELNKSDFTGL